MLSLGSIVGDHSEPVVLASCLLGLVFAECSSLFLWLLGASFVSTIFFIPFRIASLVHNVEIISNVFTTVSSIVKTSARALEVGFALESRSNSSSLFFLITLLLGRSRRRTQVDELFLSVSRVLLVLLDHFAVVIKVFKTVLELFASELTRLLPCELGSAENDFAVSKLLALFGLLLFLLFLGLFKTVSKLLVFGMLLLVGNVLVFSDGSVVQVSQI